MVMAALAATLLSGALLCQFIARSVVSSQEEGVSVNYCNAHLSLDKASHLAVLPCPFSREGASILLFSGVGMLGG